MNVEMRDILGYFLNPPMCIVRKDGNPQSVQSAATVSIEWDTVVYDNDAMFGVDASRFTCNTPGYYMFTWQFHLFAKTAPGSSSRTIDMRRHSASAALLDRALLHNARVQQSNESYAGSNIVELAATDYVKFYCFNFESTDHQIAGYDSSQSQYGCQVSVRWLGTP